MVPAGAVNVSANVSNVSLSIKIQKFANFTAASQP
jgi:hypothetical protein